MKGHEWDLIQLCTYIKKKENEKLKAQSIVV